MDDDDTLSQVSSGLTHDVVKCATESDVLSSEVVDDTRQNAIAKVSEFFRNASREEIDALDRRTREWLVSEGEGNTPELQIWPNLRVGGSPQRDR